jgi:hypothetical protein
MKTKKVQRPRILGTLVIFVGLYPEDHHKVLCIEEPDGKRHLPMKVLPEGSDPDSVALDLKDDFIEDENPGRQWENAYSRLHLPNGTVRVCAHIEVIDGRCWMKSPHHGIWVPYGHLLGPEQPAEVWEAVLAVAHKQRGEEELALLKIQHHLK